MSTNRLVVPPTVTMLAMIKTRLIGATKGHALLKKKVGHLNPATPEDGGSPAAPENQRGESVRFTRELLSGQTERRSPLVRIGFRVWSAVVNRGGKRHMHGIHDSDMLSSVPLCLI